MGSTSFWGFSYRNLLLVFLNLLFFRNLFIYFIFLSVLVFLYIVYFFVTQNMLWAPLEFGPKTSAQKEGKEAVFLSD